MFSFSVAKTNVEFKPIELDHFPIFSRKDLGVQAVMLAGGCYFVMAKNKLHSVPSYFVDPSLRKRSVQEFNEFMKSGYVTINQFDSGEYSIRANTRGLGGGPIGWALCYYGTKVVGYGMYAAVVYADPAALTQAHTVVEGVETTAILAGGFGAALPF